MPNYEITVSVHIPDALDSLLMGLKQARGGEFASPPTIEPVKAAPPPEPEAGPDCVGDINAIKEEDFNTIKEAALAYGSLKGRPALLAVLESLGVKKLTDLEPQQYEKFKELTSV